MPELTATPQQARSEGKPDRLLCQFTGYNMKRAYMLVQEDMSEVLGPFGLRIGTFSALGILTVNPGISQSRLAEILDIKRSGAVVVVDELEQAGVIARDPVEGDRRAYALRVTPAGQRLWEKAEAAVQKHESKVFSRLSAQERTQLHELLARAAVRSADQ